MKEDKKDIRSLCAPLTSENKKYVIAVANALLFSQKKAEEGACKVSAGHRI